VAAGGTLPALHGVPTAIKDLNMVAGVPLQLGSRVMQGFVPGLSDVTVERMRAAGTISLGKTNTPEFGLPCYTETDVAPPARTPWDLTRSAEAPAGERAPPSRPGCSPSRRAVTVAGRSASRPASAGWWA
jgi:amidase